MTSPIDSAYGASARKRKREEDFDDDKSDLTSLSGSEGGDSDIDMMTEDSTGPDEAGARAPAYDEESDHVRKTLAKAQRLLLPIDWPISRILMIGASGAGKSSTVNNAFEHDLAKVMAAGLRCNDVPESHGKPFATQTKLLAARVVPLGPAAIQKLVRDLLSDYYAWHCEPREDWPEENLDEIERRASTAFRAFRGLFGDKPSFAGDNEAHKYLQDMFDSSIYDIQTDLSLWCNDMARSISASSDMTLLEADTKEDLQTMLQPYNSSSGVAGSITKWPLVDRICIGIQGCRFAQAVTIIDCPGTGDMDPLRSRAYERLVNECDEIWLVERIVRILSNDSILAMLQVFARRSMKVVVIATRSDDDINDGLCDYLENEGGNVTELRHHLKTVSSLEQKVLKIHREIEGCQPKLRSKRQQVTPHKPSSKQPKLLTKLNEKLEKAQRALRDARQASFVCSVESRNRFVTRSLDKQYSKYLPVGKQELLVYCISNKHYAARRKGITEDDTCLPLHATGIPALRKHEYDILAPKLLHTLINYVEIDFSDFANSLDLLSNPVLLRGHKEAIALLDSADLRLEALMTEHLDGMKALASDQLIEPLIARREVYESNALAVWERKKTWKWQTLKAFLWVDGRHEGTKQQNKQSWDDQFAMTAANELDALRRDDFESQLLSSMEALGHALAGLVREIAEQIKAHAANEVLNITRLDRVFKGQENKIKEQCQTFVAAVERNAANACSRAMRDSSTSYFSLAMEPAYTRCKNDRGRGMLGRCFEVLARHLSLQGEQSPFVVSLRQIEANMQETIRTRASVLLAEMQENLLALRGQLNTRFNEDCNPEEKALLDDLKEVHADVERCVHESKDQLQMLVRKHETADAMETLELDD
ncbi:hypothetical protein LTR17_020559 [Elasticomyces elasticus]|nr:hypothetical protein LTR17_020559 [Elasticomyces elasticus]